MAFDMSKIGVKLNVPKVNFTDYSGVFVAPPKFGKTTTAALFPNAIIVPFENGFNAQVVNYVEGMRTWDDFIAFVDKLEKHRKEIGNDLQTLVFDTADKAYEKCLTYMLKKESIKDGEKYTNIGDISHGKGYGLLDQYFKVQLDRIQNLGFTFLFLSHSQVKTIKPKNGTPYDVYTSTMADRLEKIIYPLVDFIIFGERRKIVDETLGTSTAKRVLVVSNMDADASNGSRVALKSDIVFDTEEEAVGKFQEHFREAIVEKLEKAGITRNVAEIAKEQAEQKAKDVENYIASQNELSPEELVAEIKAKFVVATADAKAAMSRVLEANGIKSLANATEFEVSVLKEILDSLL